MTYFPILSVIMSVYNGSPFLRTAIESVLSQTFFDFEFIITDDGSTDDTTAILDEYAEKDRRINVIRQPNTGLTESLNRMAAMAQGEFIARMDADDISLPKRFEKQLKKLRENPDYLAVGCWFQTINGNDVPTSEIFFPDKPDLLRQYLEEGINCYGHGSVMIRREVFHGLGLSYRFRYGQDFDLWLRLSEQRRLGMVEEVLYQRRDHGHALSKALIPQRAALMRLMRSLMKERKIHGREVSDWKDEESKVFNGVSLWTRQDIEAHDLFLEARRLLCSGENARARKILSSIRKGMKHFGNSDVPYFLSFFPGFLTAAILRSRDSINNKRHFVKPLNP